MRRLRRCLSLLVAALVATSGLAADPPGNPRRLDDLLTSAASLLREGKAEQAWQLLSPHEPEFAGRQDFDYRLAVAALESGRENLATFILERVLAVNPGHAGARLELARALFALRDFERAEREFDAVLKADPPPAIRETVRRYQVSMRRGDEASETPLRGYAEVSAGRDSNVNAASSQGSVFVPGLGTDFVPTSQRQRDSFAVLGAGLEAARSLDAGKSLSGAADVRLRKHADVSEFDSQVLDLQGGLRLPLGERDSLRLGLHLHEYRQDEASYRRMQSASGQWSRPLAGASRVSAFGQASRIRYLRDDVRTSSSNLFVLGIGGAHALRAGTLSGSVHAGFDKAVADREDGDRVLGGATIAWQERRLLPAAEAFAAASFLRSDYRQENPSFATLRRDRQSEVVVGLSWRAARGWMVRPQIAYTDNRSNLELNAYHRAEVSISLRRSWE